MGKVYIFNPSSSLVQYTVNGGRTPFVQGTASDVTPSFVAVQRQAYISNGVFGYGNNQFATYFQDADPDKGEPHDHYFTIEIMNNYSLLDDIIIYSYRTMLLVMSTSGFPVSPQGLFINETSSDDRG